MKLTEWEKNSSIIFGRWPFIDCSMIDMQTKHDLIIELSRKNIPPGVIECPYQSILHVDLGSFRTRWISSRQGILLNELKRSGLILSATYVLKVCREHTECNDALAYQVVTRPI